ncbi:uncharacterized protein LOC135249859 isoform X2 [Anguilla rostrata]|uniref:uncharacterized protein LOC135249859 isoform X2 n=1 Tax=Anguilla rostrata TaxID=7938 RepID=UPI0030CFC8B7
MDIKTYHTISILLCLFSGESCDQTVYGKIGETVYLHLQESHGRSFNDTQWWHHILTAKTARSVNTFAEVFSNGTLKLHNVGRNCSGVYTAEAYDDQGKVQLKESSHLVLIDPPVVELVVCRLGVSVLHCAGENGPDAVYEWRVSIQNQGRLKISIHTGKFVAPEYSTGNISCSLKTGNYSSQSASYSLYCAGENCGQTVYGKIGENVYLHLRKSHGRSFPDFKWWHQNAIIANTARSFNTFAEVFSNGTLKLHNVGRNCSGVYTVSAHNAQGKLSLKESSHLVVIDPPVVELVACILGVSVLYCAGENGPDAVYEWRVSIQNQGGLNVSSHTGKHVTLDYSTGNISCSLIMGNYSSRSASYSLSCAETQWCVSLGVTVMLVLLCFMACGISVGVQICRKRQNSSMQKSISEHTPRQTLKQMGYSSRRPHRMPLLSPNEVADEKSEGSGPFLEMTHVLFTVKSDLEKDK